MAKPTRAALKKQIATDLQAAYPGAKVEQITEGLAVFLPPVDDYADFLVAVTTRADIAAAIMKQKAKSAKPPATPKPKAPPKTTTKANIRTPPPRGGVIKPKPPIKPRKPR